MFSPRILTLALGPMALIGLSYRLAMPVAGRAETARAAVESVSPPVGRGAGLPRHELRAVCEQRAAEVRARLDATCRVLVRPPFVLGGDLTAEELERMHRAVIAPTAYALSVCYFDRPPEEPVTILLFADGPSYRAHGRRWDRRDVSRYYGYYHRDDRRVMVNMATGVGTLRHELTHALAHADFPSLPEWFDEGLAALHEECEITADGLRLEGKPNRRGALLRQEIAQDRLPSVHALLAQQQIRPERADVDYAHARGLCLYLQDRGLLAPFYRKLRHNAATDPTGIGTLCQLLHAQTLDDLDRDFRAWAMQQK